MTINRQIGISGGGALHPMGSAGGGGSTLGVYASGAPDWHLPSDTYIKAMQAMQMRQAYALDFREQLEARLRMSIESMAPKGLQHIFIAPSNGKVYVFCIAHDKPVILEDDEKMYPSDTLITQLRTMMD